jgi:hypothetical protein
MQFAYRTLDDDTKKEALAATFTYHAALEAAALTVKSLFPNAKPDEMKVLIQETAQDYISQTALLLDMSENVEEQVFADTLRAGLHP